MKIFCSANFDDFTLDVRAKPFFFDCMIEPAQTILIHPLHKKRERQDEFQLT